MLKKTTLALILGSMLLAGCQMQPTKTAEANFTPADPKKQTPQGLYIDAKGTYAMMQKDPKVILVDVRTPAEWQFVGYSPMAQIMVSSIEFDFSKVDAKKPRYASGMNPDFLQEFEAAADKLGADQDTTYVLMCRSGATRAQPAAKMLAQYGYNNVYIMTDGFEGSTTKEGPQKGYRLTNGWKVEGLPWTTKINTQTAYTQ
jgi:rhodanese-related sulfurtransferase